MHVCRTCLTVAVEKDISQLETDLEEEKQSCFEIMLFCLDLKVLKLKSTRYAFVIITLHYLQFLYLLVTGYERDKVNYKIVLNMLFENIGLL